MIWWILGYIAIYFGFSLAICGFFHTESDDRFYADYPEAEIAPGDMIAGFVAIIWPITLPIAITIWIINRIRK